MPGPTHYITCAPDDNLGKRQLKESPVDGSSSESRGSLDNGHAEQQLPTASTDALPVLSHINVSKGD